MASDWIKVRTNLWDDPRVMRLCDATDQPEAMVVGALYWLWATADTHSEDGLMQGMSLQAIDRKTGVKGFANALCDIGWLSNEADGVRIANFDEHNGASAKKRCQTAKRVASSRSANADETPTPEDGNDDVTPPSDECNAPSVTDEVQERYLEVEVEQEVTTTTSPSPSGKFLMFDGWQPSPHFPASMHSAGLPTALLSPERLTEFISYRKSFDKPELLTQKQWDHKFLQTLISAKNNGVSHEKNSVNANNGRSFGKQSTHARASGINREAAGY